MREGGREGEREQERERERERKRDPIVAGNKFHSLFGPEWARGFPARRRRNALKLLPNKPLSCYLKLLPNKPLSCYQTSS